MRKIALVDSVWILFVFIQKFIWICFGPIAGPVLYHFWHGFICWLFLLVFVQHYMPQSFEKQEISLYLKSIYDPQSPEAIISSTSSLFQSIQLFQGSITEAFLPTSTWSFAFLSISACTH